ncbi:STAS domain-containing protein [Desulfallas sp. Bu1-1]|uniref:STAS domain-containing protein n=1 Tax=Desulfallas sp. Bu1-1 TaxID=2787620 RepID=UPI00189F1FC6|nr:STAS domain-containing protein [Desulfallas sp. Bu1-1]MBF7084202.1 STAS domain-containing protein [Desulfallas sp. Bu1-1]
MGYSFINQEGYLVVQLQDLFNITQVKEFTADLCSRPERHLVLDMSNLTGLDMAALQVLWAIRQAYTGLEIIWPGDRQVVERLELLGFKTN